ncbi:Oleoyl-(acyl-carrier-protein) hydrolas [Klebsormidium nitens]|uniref:Oleoyl-(Acyl-carrier-protein) hydrolas n=1 Tax=Klebsormidium nitens TaxID=105231 RepID=A0A1Y1IDG2_KLENI|nr:Oleoyl-(acyl-carrier-protein) hydrolas [Klebsormidium nitens]|eukprot:GAQ87479.1 Oleoyl-(acyl-carrier-protein) hydrolas [Klebsormidium nitens]
MKDTLWISRTEGVDCSTQEVQLCLACFPAAGTGAWVFNRFARDLPQDIEVLPIEYPGSGQRSLEKRHTSMQDIVQPCVAALLPVLAEKPVALFGHSLGAWIAFEVAHQLEERGVALKRLYACAERAPHLSAVSYDVDPTTFHVLDEPAFWHAFERRYGLPRALQTEVARRFAYPRLRADLEVFETYVPSTSRRLDCDLVAIGAESDPRYTPDQISAWRQHTAGAFEERWFAGGHQFVREDPETLLAYLKEDLARTIQGQNTPTAS